MADVLERAKKSVSLPQSLVDAVEQRIDGTNFSSYVAKALQTQLLHDHLETLAAELDAAHGRPPQSEIDARARRLLGL
ncbi:MAG: hypothetical protein LBK95_09480 [Bifidobacteriaceae bacterium]|jgi:hypothetical protein|nr:hypothetical protein [Bifidobacteriaceae bacterium]